MDTLEKHLLFMSKIKPKKLSRIPAVSNFTIVRGLEVRVYMKKMISYDKSNLFLLAHKHFTSLRPRT